LVINLESLKKALEETIKSKSKRHRKVKCFTEFIYNYTG